MSDHASRSQVSQSRMSASTDPLPQVVTSARFTAYLDNVATVGATAVVSDVKPAELVPGYEVLGELGRGGMGIVYRARQVKADRIVALRMILSGVHADDAELTRFRVEAEAIARLQHPNIVQVFEVGEHADRPYFSTLLAQHQNVTDDSMRPCAF